MRRTVALLVGAGLTLTACGTDDDAPIVSTTHGPTAEPTPQTSLTIAFDSGDGTEAQEWTLTCEPEGGSHPDPGAACAALGGLDATVFAPVRADLMCTQVYGGPQTATVSGNWGGQAVDASFSRENGCEIARWDAATAVLGESSAG